MTTATPTVSAEDIGQRVLKLIASLRNAGDLTPERIEQATGLRVEISTDDRNVYGFSGDIDDHTYHLGDSGMNGTDAMRIIKGAAWRRNGTRHAQLECPRPNGMHIPVAII